MLGFFFCSRIHVGLNGVNGLLRQCSACRVTGTANIGVARTLLSRTRKIRVCLLDTISNSSGRYNLDHLMDITITQCQSIWNQRNGFISSNQPILLSPYKGMFKISFALAMHRAPNLVEMPWKESMRDHVIVPVIPSRTFLFCLKKM